MTLNELVDKDPTFNQTEFISKANLMIKKILNSITLNELDKVQHLLATKTITFEKNKNTLPNNNAICPGCGKSLAINESEKCPHCGRIFNLEDYDYIIKEFDIIEGE